ncbi:unnamed protein product [Pocillopora meandrina]|uniref:EGF-like domain-containing protein n=1 Tax=Pocillopora meandrina TaxID=46732 RepID=A0AAU9Y3W3_9CNID|nr:unnamed protein product [Pocillopora meandrina]
MAFSSKILLLVGISLAQFYIVHGQSYMNWVGRCCTKGHRKASRNYDPSSCNSDDLDRRRFNTKFERWICRLSERVCCMKEIQKKSCQSGIFEALLGNSCGRFMPFVGGDDFRECCDCCSLGVIAKANNDTTCSAERFPAMLLSNSSIQCIKTFKQCCKGTISLPTVLPTARKPKCSDNFCQQECQDSPTQGAQCTCRDGYLLKPDKVSCQDINECKLRGGNTCSPLERCINTPGSYRCEKGTTEAACKLGEQLVDGSCVDIDECVRGLHRCGAQQTCVNNDGSYVCTCRSGFQASGTFCIDKDECSTREARCPQYSSCVNNQGSYRCQCEKGRQLLNNKCEDIDECSSGKSSCTQGTRCENTDGSYKCTRITVVCRSDQVLTANGTCKPKALSVCERVQCGSGFVCNPNAPRRPCEDIDECSQSPPKCKAGEVCLNYIGSYECRDSCRGVDCGKGLKCQPSGRSYSCTDIDECATLPRRCTGDQEICENYYGGYRCKCRDRFQRNSQTRRCERRNSCSSVKCPRGYKCLVIDDRSYRCKDIDECSESPPVCLPGQRCVNYAGGHYCSCRNGYRLNSITNRCEDIDECTERRSGCSQICDNTPGSYVCRCRRGFRLAADKRSCIDVNECLNSPCSGKGTCRNTFGSFVCRCNRGYELLADGLTCRDRNECNSVTCPYRCVNTRGAYYCICPSGYSNQSRYYCTDNDECQAGKDKCKDDEFCFNTYGFYQCIPKLSCSSDYVQVSDTRCDRKSCKSGDQACFNQKVQKKSLWTFRMRNNETSSTIFNYRIFTYGYKVRPMVKFYFNRGNELGFFEIQTQDESNGVSASIRNKEAIEGRRRFIMEFYGDVIDAEKGELVSRFEHLMYIFVSRYDY